METYKRNPTAKLKKPLPDRVNFRELDREGVITRAVSYMLKSKGASILLETAQEICEYANIKLDDYFIVDNGERPYAAETIKGTRRLIRTIFNEALRYDWITKNPVTLTKVCGGNGNVSLKPVKEKEVFSECEAQAFIRKLDMLSDEYINRKICLKILILTGLRMIS